MALETGTYISDLVVTNPTGSDPLAQADDHLRLLKSTLKNTFPNVNGAVTKTEEQINDGLEKAGGTMTGPLTLSGAPTVDLHAATKKYIDDKAAALYPVGSVYVNAVNATNPETLLGFGTWVAFGAGRVPVGFNAADTSFNAAEKTGGSKDAIVVAHSHTASTVITDPGHSHTYTFKSGTGGSAAGGDPNSIGNASYATSTDTTGITASTTVNSTGSSGTNANLQPYITVYMWKRTA